MKLPRRAPPRGIALIIVMIVIVVFGILAGGFAYSMKVETTLARNASTDADLEWQGRSGVEWAKYILSQPGHGGMQYDALNQFWAGGTGETNEALMDLSRKLPFDWKIEDLDRKFNINTINPANTVILRQALILIGTDAAETPRIMNAVLDWIDPDDDTQLGSSDTESSYYQTRNPPHRAKNGPIDDLTEMLQINGVTPAMFYGSGNRGGHSRFNQSLGFEHSRMDEPIYPVGFVDLFTTLSGGMININTASATVLQMVPEVDENLAQAIITARSGPDGIEGNEDDTPFRSVGELGRVPGMSPPVVAQFARHFNVRSTTFEVHIEAKIGDRRRRFVAILRREGRSLQTLCFHWR